MVTTLLLDTLRDADLEQYYPSFSTHGITQLESLAQLSMQDYSSLGITSIPDRRKLFQLVQKLRQELPTLENGLVSSPITANNTTSSSATTTTTTTTASPTTTPATLSSSGSVGGIPSPSIATPTPTSLKTPQTYRRRPLDSSSLLGSKGISGGTGIPDPSFPSTQQRRIPQATISSSSNMVATTRSRSRTLPDQAQRPDNIKPISGGGGGKSPNDRFSAVTAAFQDDYESSDEEEKCEIRRGSGPLLDPYGVPISGKRAAASQRAAASGFTMTAPSSFGTSPAGSSNSPVTITGGGGTGHALQSDLNQKIRVVVRKRPLNKKEVDRGEKDISPTCGIRSINVNEPKMKVDLTRYIEQHSFTYDDVFDNDASNEQVYQRTAAPLVKYIFGGGKATCFAYGQTGSGKTFTMLDQKHGLYVLAARDIFNMLRTPEYQNLTAWIGFYEIYQGQLYDLLNNRKKLFAREDGKQNVVIVGLKEYVINNVNDLMQVFEYGSQARSTGSTGANSDSSRSHAILQILLKPLKSRKKIIGKLSFIDLAGSERGADRGDADAKTRMEGAEINKSLLALKECIRALDQDKRHTPFRQSKLTQVLKDSFVGNSRTCMIATISPNQSNSEHTLNTLRYADRVKELKGERDRRVLGGESQGDVSPNTRVANDELDYGNDDSYQDDYGDIDYGESDDPELYNEADDNDLFLDEEYFPSDSDVNILDEDFPHENRLFHEPIGNASRRQQAYADSMGMTQTRTKPLADPQQQHSPKQHHRPPTSRHHSYHRGSPRSSDLQQQDAHGLMMASSPDNVFDPSEFSRSRHGSSSGASGRPPTQQQLTSSGSSMHRSHSTASGNEFNMMPAKMSSPQNTTDDDDILFEQDTIEDFIKYHRGEIREVAECSKKETKLLANFSLYMTSLKEQNEGQRRPDDDLKMSSEFIDYLDRLDEVLEMKMGAIEALRDRIRNVLGEEDI
ncbi:kinesin-domain-containing protein [Lichtheimia hyalospora FSU 10163]|nr:kinesin-domain-containing protein [Lichtheimia hyalospora FSU 10163]